MLTNIRNARKLQHWILILMAWSCGLSLLANVGSAAAQDIVPPPTRIVDQPLPNGGLYLKTHKLDVEIENQVAISKIEQTLVNTTGREREAVYLFPVPTRSTISDFSMFVNGKRMEAQVLDKQQARSIYEEIVRSQRDPALLEYVGQGVVRVSIYPVPANGQTKIQFQYNQVLKAEQGLAEYVYPLNLPQFSSRPVEELSINLNVKSKDGLKALYSPSHTVNVVRSGAGGANVSYTARNVRPERDFQFFFGAGEGDFSLNFMTYRDVVENGVKTNYFMLLVTPKITEKVDSKQIVAKDVLLVLDTSGSMQGEKIVQARKALKTVISSLNSQDRFNIVAFESYVKSFESGLQGMERRQDALNWVDRIPANGGTNINDALTTAMQQAKEARQANRPQMVIFLTDGLPTSGETDAGRILKNVKNAATEDIRLFSFGVGYDVNTSLLDSLASQNRGSVDYVKPSEDVEEKVSRLYNRISQPVLTNLSLEVEGLDVQDFYPQPLPDLFSGSQLVLAGKFYPKSGTKLPETTKITLKGYVNGQAVSFEYKNLQVTGDNDSSRDFIPRLWAGRRVGNLLTQIQANTSTAANRELIDEITRLSLRYGIITPYTSFLVQEENVAPGRTGGSGSSTSAASTTAAALADSRYQATVAASIAAAAQAAPVSGAGAVSNSQQTGSLANSSTVAESRTESIRYAGDKTFILRNNIWVDSTYDGKVEPEKIAFGSPAYFQLTQKRSEWSKYFAVSNELLVVLDNQPYRIGANGQTTAQQAPDTTPVVVSNNPTSNATSVAVSNNPTSNAPTTATPEIASQKAAGADNSWLAWVVGGLLLISSATIIVLRRKGTSK